MTTPTAFEDRLLHELRQVVAEQHAPADVPAGGPRPARRVRLALSGAGLAAAVAAVAIIASAGDGPSSAYAVEPNANGSVTVHISGLSDAAGLQRSLRAAGVPATVNYAPGGRLPQCPVPAGAGVHVSESGQSFSTGGDAGPSGHRSGSTGGSGPATSSAGSGNPEDLPAPPPGASVMTSQVSVNSDGVTFTVDPGNLKPDQQLVVTTSSGTLSSIGMAVTSRSSGPCSAAPPPGP